MPTSNAINANSSGLVRYNGSGTFDSVTTTNHDVLIGSTSNGITNVGPGSSGQVLQSGGASADPAYSTATYPATTTVSQILYSSSANVVAGLTTANDGVLITSHTGVPSLLAAGTTGQVLTATTGAPASWAAAPGGGLQSATVVITSAQVKAIRATPITIVSAQGSGKMIVFVSGMSKLTYGGTNAFTNGQILNLYYNTSAGVQVTVPSFIPAASVTGTANAYNAQVATVFVNTAATSLENVPIVLQNAGASEITGNAANNNTITVTIVYYVITI